MSEKIISQYPIFILRHSILPGLLGKEQSAILVGDSLHKKLGETDSGAITKTNLKLFADVGTDLPNLPADVKSVKAAFNRGFNEKKLNDIMSITINEDEVINAQFIQLIYSTY